MYSYFSDIGFVLHRFRSANISNRNLEKDQGYWNCARRFLLGIHTVLFRNKIYLVFEKTRIEIRQNPLPHHVRTIILSITMLFECHGLHHYNALHNCIGLIAREILLLLFCGTFFILFPFLLIDAVHFVNTYHCRFVFICLLSLLL